MSAATRINNLTNADLDASESLLLGLQLMTIFITH